MTAERPFPVMSIAQCNALMTAPGAKFELEEKSINGVTLKTYKNAPLTLRDIVIGSQEWASREYIVYEDERITFGANFKAAVHLANKLRNEFGVK